MFELRQVCEFQAAIPFVSLQIFLRTTVAVGGLNGLNGLNWTGRTINLGFFA
jgi:hypothetical protein